MAQRSHELDLANQALSKSEQRLALALQASELGLWDWNLETDEVHHTQLHALFGLDAEQVRTVAADLKPRLHPDDLPLLRRTLVEHLKGRTEDYRVEYRVRHAQGHWCWIEDRGRAVESDAAGKVLRMLGTRRDITVQKIRKSNNAWPPRCSRRPAKASPSSMPSSSCWRSTRRSATSPAMAAPS